MLGSGQRNEPQRLSAAGKESMSEPIEASVRTKRHALAQLVLCKGCCCGRTDKGRPELPEERLTTAWKNEHLLKTIQLTVSGCLGPCDVPNVVQIVTPEGTEWYGRIEGAAYDQLVEWARACKAANRVLPRPAALDAHRFGGLLTEEKPCVDGVTPP